MATSGSPSGSSEIGRITPAGAFTEFPLPAGHSSLGGLTVGPDGNLWFTEVRQGTAIGRITPAGAITEFPLPAAIAPGRLTVGPDGNLWFAEKRSTRSAGSRPPASSLSSRSPANSVPRRSDGRPRRQPLVHRVYGEAAIGRITPAGALTEFPLPARHGSPGDLTAGPDGNLWFIESSSAGSVIGRITPAGAITSSRYPRPSDMYPSISLVWADRSR